MSEKKQVMIEAIMEAITEVAKEEANKAVSCEIQSLIMKEVNAVAKESVANIINKNLFTNDGRLRNNFVQLAIRASRRYLYYHLKNDVSRWEKMSEDDKNKIVEQLLKD